MKTLGKANSRFVKTKLFGVFLLLLTAGTFIFFVSARSNEELLPVEAPLNPEFLEYIEMQEQGLIRPMYTAEGYPLGLIPSPVDVQYTDEEEEIGIEEVTALPKTYDLRNKNKLTDIRNQGSCGSCWAFTAMGALESSLMPMEAWDFSEQHLITNHGFKWKPCGGGNLLMAVAYLARRHGPVDESDHPYQYSAHIRALDAQKHVRDVVYFPERKNANDNKDIKKAVQKYGAVYITMKYVSSKYNPVYCAYYNPDLDEGAHGVNIVGWDDTFSKDKFNETPPGDGAFICRNSWGTDWGEDGYFYISYYDEYLGKDYYNAAFAEVGEATEYTDIYEYDKSGWTGTYGWPPDNTAWFANIFKAEASHSLGAVSFYAVGKTNTYTVYIYTGVNDGQPRSGVLKTQKSGRFKSPGYYTIDIGEVPLTKGEKFSVVVEMTTKGYEYPIPLERRIKKFTLKKNCKGKIGESFVSHYGDYWFDLCSLIKNSNVCLKAFAK